MELTPLKNELKLDDVEDAITWMEVTYDKLGSGGTYKVLDIYVVNRDKLDEEDKDITCQILSSIPAAKLPDGRTAIGTYNALKKTYTLDVYEVSDYLKLSAVLSNEKVTLGTNAVYNIEENAKYASSIQNTVGVQIKDVAVEYNIAPEFYTNRVVVTLSSTPASAYPSKAIIEYKINNGAEIKTAELIPGQNELKLEDETAVITWMKITYDKLGSGGTYKVLDIYLANKGNGHGESKDIAAQIVSAVPSETLPDGNDKIMEQEQKVYSYTLAIYNISAPTMSISTASLEKGKPFTLTFQSSGTAKVYVDNPVYYILMPKGYVIGNYTSAYSGVPYSIEYDTDKVINVDSSKSASLGSDTSSIPYVPEGEYVLYTISYVGKNLIADATHKVNFTVGAEVDTSVYNAKLYLPPLLLASHENAGFPYNTSVYGATEAEKDIMGLSDTGVRTSNRPFAEIKKGVGISILSFVTSEYGKGGREDSKDYLYRTNGTYEQYLYNGLGSAQSVKDIEIVIALPRKGETLVTGGTTEYKSDWDAILTGEPSCKGTVFTNAAISYSEDGGNSYQDNPINFKNVTHVKIITAEGEELKANETAKIILPFATDFEEGVSPDSKAYMNANTYYTLQGESNISILVTTPSTLNAVAIPVLGHVYQDYAGKLEHNVDGEPYKVTLYSGSYTAGQEENSLSVRAADFTEAATGVYTNDTTIIAPGYYTLRVEKSLNETFLAGSDWNIDGNYAYYTFQITGEQSEINWQIFVVMPRTLTVSGFTSGDYLYDTDTYTLTATPSPALDVDAGEELTFISSNPEVVTIDDDGKLQYVGEGEAVITVRVPQLTAFIGTFGAWVEEEFYVKARKSDSSISLYTEKGNILSEGFTKKSDGEFIGTYKAGDSYTLPNPNTGTGEEIYYFAGWYDNEEKTGSRITEIAAEDYGDKSYWAKWEPYEVMYETSADNWEYDTFITAVDQVYDGGQIKFLADYSLDSDVEIEKTIILKTDGDTKMVQCSDYQFLIMGDGVLKIDDGELILNGTNSYGIIYKRQHRSGRHIQWHN